MLIKEEEKRPDFLELSEDLYTLKMD